MKNSLVKTKKEQFAIPNLNRNFRDVSLLVCMISFFGKIQEHEICQVKIGQSKMTPIFEDIYR